jgi:hypothetical protein
LTIKECGVKRDLSQEWYYADNTIIEIALTEQQFCEMITNPNCGDGVPCTIDWRQGIGSIEHEEPDETPRKIAEREMREVCQEAISTLSELYAAIDVTTTSGKQKDTLRGIVAKVERGIGGSIPFIESQFKERLDATESECKIAVEGYLSHRIHLAGVDAIEARNAIAQLPEPEKGAEG